MKLFSFQKEILKKLKDQVHQELHLVLENDFSVRFLRKVITFITKEMTTINSNENMKKVVFVGPIGFKLIDGRTIEQKEEDLFKTLVAADKKFKELLKKYDDDLEELYSHVNIDKLLPKKEVESFLNEIKEDKEKVKQFVQKLDSQLDSDLYYGPIIEDVAYTISPELYGFMDSFIRTEEKSG